MKVTVCIGSSCHIKGSRQVVEQLQYLIAKTISKTKWISAVRSVWASANRAYA